MLGPKKNRYFMPDDLISSSAVQCDPNLRTRISADASSFGNGGMLEQLHDFWKPVVLCSKSLSPTEQLYAQIEKEALAITWTCERLQQFLTGKTFEILTDHKPLVQILQSKPIND